MMETPASAGEGVARPPAEAIPTFADMSEEERREYWASLALRHCRGLGARSCVRLLRHFGSAYVAVQSRKSWGGAQIPQNRADELATGSWRVTAKEEWDKARHCRARILLWTHRQYPARLRQLSDAPVLLYCRGDVSLLQSAGFAIVGSRKATEQSMAVAAYMARCLAACGMTIISGMAQGIDSMAHSKALQKIGSSIGVLGTGIDVRYPAASAPLYVQMEEKGLLLSEFAPSTRPTAQNFPIRNRIISGLALGVLVVEAAQRSGSLITARMALEQNREVYAVPGPALDVHCMGCQELIRQGARPVFTADDILRDLAEQLHPFGISAASLPPAEKEFSGPEEILPSSLHRGEGRDKASAQSPVQTSVPSSVQSGVNHRESQAGAAKPSTQTDTARSGRETASPPEVPAQAEPCPEANALLATAAHVAEDKTTGSDSVEERVLSLLRREGALHCDALSLALPMPVQEVTVILLGLEMQGRVRRLAGARYEARP